MNVETLREYCLAMRGVSEDFPFDEVTLVFKVEGKLFALTGLDGPPTVNLKCDPEWSMEMREKYEDIRPGFHMNKKHWNTIDLKGKLSEDMIKELIVHSYEMVVKKLPKKLRDNLL